MIQKVLVIDDSMVSREIMRNYLEDASVDVTAYDSGKKAVELLQSERNCEYDVVFMDIQMPDMNGYEAAKALRSLGKGFESVRIIAMSANEETEDINRAFESGMDDYIVKPVDIRKLYEMLGIYGY